MQPESRDIDHDKIQADGAHTVDLARFGDDNEVMFVHQPEGDREVQLWWRGNDALSVPAETAASDVSEAGGLSARRIRADGGPRPLGEFHGGAYRSSTRPPATASPVWRRGRVARGHHSGWRAVSVVRGRGEGSLRSQTDQPVRPRRC